MNAPTLLKTPTGAWTAAGGAIALGLLLGFYSVVANAVDHAQVRRAQQAAAASCAWQRPDARELCLLTTTAGASPATTTQRGASWQRQGVAVVGTAN